MRRIAVFCGLVTALTTAASACNDVGGLGSFSLVPLDTVVHQVIVVPESATVKASAHLTLAASVNAGAGVMDRSVVWSTSNASIASVDQTGVVTPTGVIGVVTITAASKRDTTVKGSSRVTVSP
jgi:uncharacterized protein YjdB